MAITDLTGTTWKFNDTLDFTGITLETQFEVNFKISGAFQIETYNGFWYHSGGGDNYLVYDVNEGSPSFVYNETTGQWSESKIIKIFGGTDATNSTFITWLENNATKIELNDLTNTIWTFSDNPNFYTTTSDSSLYSGTFNINFKSNGNSYTQLYEEIVISTATFSILYKKADTTSTQIYTFSNNTGTWTDNKYKTIKITGGTDATNGDLILYFLTSATQAPIPTISISYSGSEIATMEESGTKTLLTSGKYCESDIIVDYTKPTPKLQEKTITPTTSQQIVTPDNSLAGRISVGTTSTPLNGSTSVSVFTVENQNYIANATYSFQGKFVGSNGGVISLQGSKTGGSTALTLEFNTNYTYSNINITAISWWAELTTTSREQFLIQLGSGYDNITWTVAEEVIITNDAYETYEGLSKVTVNAMPSGSATTPATTITANPSISISSSGLITATTSKTQSVTPTVSAGYVSSGTAGTITISGSNTQQMTVQAAQTITPTTTAQTIASGKYLTGTQTIAGDANLVAGNIKKDVTIFGVTGTHEGGASYPAANGESF